MRRKIVAVFLLLAAGAAVWGLGIYAPPGPRSARAFDPDRLADLEVDMWRAYYEKEKVALFKSLLIALREQFRYPWAKSARAGYHLAKAASDFGKASGNYERVLPDLQIAYTISREWTGANFDPAQVARAELDWWVARREPSQRDPANVGRLISVVYAKFYEVPEEKVKEAGLLRARAADLRDRGGVNPNWGEVSRLLHESYRSLRAAL